jgi:hypothetical protein
MLDLEKKKRCTRNRISALEYPQGWQGREGLGFICGSPRDRTRRPGEDRDKTVIM